MTEVYNNILQSSASTGVIFRVCCGVLLMMLSCTMKPDNQPENPLVVGDAVLDIDTVWNTAILSFRFDTVRTKASHLNSYRQAVCGGFIRTKYRGKFHDMISCFNSRCDSSWQPIKSTIFRIHSVEPSMDTIYVQVKYLVGDSVVEGELNILRTDLLRVNRTRFLPYKKTPGFDYF
jgi:hypothetical protein